jgi:hypothetical protein
LYLCSKNLNKKKSALFWHAPVNLQWSNRIGQEEMPLREEGPEQELEPLVLPLSKEEILMLVNSAWTTFQLAYILLETVADFSK